MPEVIRPVEWFVAENERLRQELDDTNRLLNMSARVSLGLIEGLMDKQQEKQDV